ncbi:MAG: leucine--tRNA ligase [Bifidobacteriaceae bacterium]|jgi:leucyl-tRNA synthetase|nr:leucine--tRNA ligase [Bifidobacteriaceae bacterium]
MSAGDEPAFRYTAALADQIETKWQDEWERRGTFWAANPKGPLTDAEGDHADPARPKFFVMDMFPYPSGKGLHVGHPLGYIATDVVGRYRRMLGDNVLHAFGYDAFGLPAEQYALQTGQHPRLTTEDNITTMRAQIRRLGLAHDERRSFATTDETYVRWTQWIFLQMFNSWYDPEAPRRDGGQGAARPIAELEEAFAAGRQDVPGGGDWNAMHAAARRRVLNQFRLAYITDAPVNWAPGLGTVLANEEVTADGRSERGNFPVFTKALRQWNMRITAYAGRLAEDLDSVDWPQKVVAMQRNWIGRSGGAAVTFKVAAPGMAATTDGPVIEVFTTRPDTLFGATFMVVSPEHPLLAQALPEDWPEGTKEAWTGGYPAPSAAVSAYATQAAKKTAAERVAEGREKSGVFTGLFAINPVNDQAIPVFTADYVLMGYGTGAIMAVPAEDERDWEFAKAFDLPHVRTVEPPADWAGGAWTGAGQTINSANATVSLNGLDVPRAKERIIGWLAERGLGRETVSYRLRDWLFSRQRYWGEPFPVVYGEDDQPIALPDAMLPVELPEVPDYRPRTFDPEDADSEPETPLARNPEWVNIILDLGEGRQNYRRDTNTMPNWAGSCWYYLRYLDPDESGRVVDPDEEDYWMAPRVPGDLAGGVDLYVGGVEHAVLHLLYARFWHKVLYDLGFVSGTEPFHRLFNQGYIQAYAYVDQRGQYVPADEVVEDPPGVFTYTATGESATQEYGKMGKSLKNIVTPDDMYASYGADTFRLYEMSMGPLDVSRPWETRAVVGQQRFLQRLWRNVIDETTGEVRVSDQLPTEETIKLTHRVVNEVRQEMDAMRFNTAIARMMVLNNHLTSLDAPPRAAIETLVKLLAPVAPHVCEELWQRLGHPASLAHEPYPEADPAYLVEDTVTAVVQIQGKVRARLEVSAQISVEDLAAKALADPAVVAALDGRPVRRVVARPPKLVNLVV